MLPSDVTGRHRPLVIQELSDGGAGRQWELNGEKAQLSIKGGERGAYN